MTDKKQENLTDVKHISKACIENNNAFKNTYDTLPPKDEIFKSLPISPRSKTAAAQITLQLCHEMISFPEIRPSSSGPRLTEDLCSVSGYNIPRVNTVNKIRQCPKW